MKNNEKEIKEKGKICPECKIFKLSNEFFMCSTRKDGLQCYCKVCKKEKFKESKKKSDKKYNTNWYSKIENKLEKSIYCKNYQKVNYESQVLYNKKYKKSDKGKKHNLEYRKEEYKNKYGIDILWTLKLLLRNRLKNALINKSKKSKTLELLGCSIEEFKIYLEKQFDKNMTWGNRGKYWEIDHIKPCDSFDLLNYEEQKKCFYYKNLQPLEKIKNRIKSNKYE